MDCLFCSEELPSPTPLAGAYSLERVLGGRCTCGAVFLLDETGHNGGQAVMDLLFLLAGGDLDKALSLRRDLDVAIKQAKWTPSAPGQRKFYAERAPSQAVLWVGRLLSLFLLVFLAGCQENAGQTDGGREDADVECPLCWRSALYPADWEPGFTDPQGRFLHDFSYAGYHYGEREPVAEPPGPRFSVIDFGADPSGASDSTDAFQQALDAATGGGVVLAPAGLYRCEGFLKVRSSGVVLRGEGREKTRIFFTAAGDISGQAALDFAAEPLAQPDVLLWQDAQPRESEVLLVDKSDLSPGDDVELGAVISEDFVAEHGMTGTWQVSLGQWRAFFRRTILAVEGEGPPYRVRLDVPVRYPLKTRDGASLRRITGMLSEVGLEDLSFSNAVSLAGAEACDRVHVVRFLGVKDGWIRRLGSFASPEGEGALHLQSGGLLIERSKRVTVSDTELCCSQNRGSGGNGYLFEIMQSSEILIRDCRGRAGRHNFIQNWDFLTSGCVFLRVESLDGRMEEGGSSLTGLSEYHHSLALANLVDSCQSNDGWGAVNRGGSSTGAGHSATQNVFWNMRGGLVRSYQFGWGYVIGTREVEVFVDPAEDLLGSLAGWALGTEPLDWAEGIDEADGLRPASLYQDQLSRRLALGR